MSKIYWKHLFHCIYTKLLTSTISRVILVVTFFYIFSFILFFLSWTIFLFDSNLLRVLCNEVGSLYQAIFKKRLHLRKTRQVSFTLMCTSDAWICISMHMYSTKNERTFFKKQGMLLRNFISYFRPIFCVPFAPIGTIAYGTSCVDISVVLINTLLAYNSANIKLILKYWLCSHCI